MNDEYLIYGETLKSIADSIRSVSSVSTTWTPDEMAAYILANLVKPTSRQAAKTYTPSTANQTIPAGTFLTGAATIQGDADLAAGNILKGKNIFGVNGVLSGVWGDASIFYGLTAVKSGSITLSAKTYQPMTVTHNLGVLPRLVVIGSDGVGCTVANTSTIMGAMMANCSTQAPASSAVVSNGYILSMAANGSSATGGAINTKYAPLSTTPYYSGSRKGTGILTNCTTTTFIINTQQSTSWYLAEGTYKWLVMG